MVFVFAHGDLRISGLLLTNSSNYNNKISFYKKTCIFNENSVVDFHKISVKSGILSCKISNLNNNLFMNTGLLIFE